MTGLALRSASSRRFCLPEALSKAAQIATHPEGEVKRRATLERYESLDAYQQQKFGRINDNIRRHSWRKNRPKWPNASETRNSLATAARAEAEGSRREHGQGVQ